MNACSGLISTETFSGEMEIYKASYLKGFQPVGGRFLIHEMTDNIKTSIIRCHFIVKTICSHESDLWGDP